jgi:hypothetical protein
MMTLLLFLKPVCDTVLLQQQRRAVHHVLLVQQWRTVHQGRPVHQLM